MTKPKIFNKIAALCSASLLVTLAGCLSDDQREELRDAAHTEILEYIETQGQEKALRHTASAPAVPTSARGIFPFA